MSNYILYESIGYIGDDGNKEYKNNSDILNIYNSQVDIYNEYIDAFVSLINLINERTKIINQYITEYNSKENIQITLIKIITDFPQNKYQKKNKVSNSEKDQIINDIVDMQMEIDEFYDMIKEQTLKISESLDLLKKEMHQIGGENKFDISNKKIKNILEKLELIKKSISNYENFDEAIIFLKKSEQEKLIKNLQKTKELLEEKKKKKTINFNYHDYEMKNTINIKDLNLVHQQVNLNKKDDATLQNEKQTENLYKQYFLKINSLYENKINVMQRDNILADEQIKLIETSKNSEIELNIEDCAINENLNIASYAKLYVENNIDNLKTHNTKLMSYLTTLKELKKNYNLGEITKFEENFDDKFVNSKKTKEILLYYDDNIIQRTKFPMFGGSKIIYELLKRNIELKEKYNILKQDYLIKTLKICEHARDQIYFNISALIVFQYYTQFYAKKYITKDMMDIFKKKYFTRKNHYFDYVFNKIFIIIDKVKDNQCIKLDTNKNSFIYLLFLLYFL